MTTKISLVGDSKTGKTELMKAINGEEFNIDYNKTQKVDFVQKQETNEQTLSLWEIGGSKKNPNFISNYLRASNVYLITASVDDKKSLTNLLNTWLPLLDKSQNTPLYLVITKQDLLNTADPEKKIKSTDIDNFIQNANLKGFKIQDVIHTSAKTEDNIQALTGKLLASQNFQQKDPKHRPAYFSLWKREKQKILKQKGMGKEAIENKEMIQQIRAILDDYTKGDSFIKRLFTFHANRHHCDQVADIVRKIDKGELQSPYITYVELNDIPNRNPKGSLQRRINFIKDMLSPQKYEPKLDEGKTVMHSTL